MAESSSETPVLWVIDSLFVHRRLPRLRRRAPSQRPQEHAMHRLDGQGAAELQRNGSSMADRFMDEIETGA
jgi:hypothetical protein